jgi:hypothetical protein
MVNRRTCKREISKALVHILYILHSPKWWRWWLLWEPRILVRRTAWTAFTTRHQSFGGERRHRPLMMYISRLFLYFILKVHTAPQEEEINISNNLPFPPDNSSALRVAGYPTSACELITLHRAAPAALAQILSIFFAESLCLEERCCLLGRCFS